MRRQRATFILRPETDINVLPQGRVERCSLHLVADSSPIAEIVKPSNHAFSTPLWPESTSQNGSGAIISSAVGVKLLSTNAWFDELTNSQPSRAQHDHATTMTTAKRCGHHIIVRKSLAFPGKSVERRRRAHSGLRRMTLASPDSLPSDTTTLRKNCGATFQWCPSSVITVTVFLL